MLIFPWGRDDGLHRAHAFLVSLALAGRERVACWVGASDVRAGPSALRAHLFLSLEDNVGFRLVGAPMLRRKNRPSSSARPLTMAGAMGKINGSCFGIHDGRDPNFCLSPITALEINHHPRLVQRAPSCEGRGHG